MHSCQDMPEEAIVSSLTLLWGGAKRFSLEGARLATRP